ncbi:MAG TPA: phytanoyl-CoA dioxygenase family protein [Chthonomonadaceae bacterium]|nr:phytanoyl-CoA dioxygenase family protein [Chthonomonadaceae bacterium]
MQQQELPETTDALYVPEAQAEGVETFDAVDAAAVARYHEDGFLVVRRGFSLEEITGARDALLDLIAGKVPTFAHIEFEAAAQAILPTLTLEQRQDAVRKLMHFGDVDPRLHAIAEHPGLLRVVSRLLEAVPVRFQDMALLKPPKLGREKPWHQDHAYFDMPLGTRIVGVWIALDPATLENGCMHLLRGGHRAGPRLHFQRRDWQICDTEMAGRGSVAVPLEPGGLLFFDGLLPHGTPHNHSPHRRRALQFHYAPEGVGNVAKEERLAVFGGEGSEVSC